jgi:hypothetical protein
VCEDEKPITGNRPGGTDRHWYRPGTSLMTAKSSVSLRGFERHDLPLLFSSPLPSPLLLLVLDFNIRGSPQCLYGELASC